MEEMAKLIWEFRGPNALRTAEHHEIHLKEYFTIEGISALETGVVSVSDFNATAFCIVAMSHVPSLRAALKPHRGQRYSNHK